MTTANTVILNATLASAKAAISDLIGSQKTRAETFATSSRNHSRNVIANLYRAGMIFMSDDNRVEFGALLTLNGVKLKEGASEWAKVIHLLIPGENQTWLNRTAALGAMAHMGFTTQKTDKRDFTADAIDVFTLQTVIKNELLTDVHRAAIAKADTAGIAGLQKLGEILNRKAGALTDADFIKSAETITPLDLDEHFVADAETKFVMVWATVVDGKVVPMGVVEKSETEARRQAIAAGKVVRATPTETEVAAVIDDKKGDIVFGDEVGSTSEPEMVLPESMVVEDLTTGETVEVGA